MKNLFIITLVLASLGGCASSGMNSYASGASGYSEEAEVVADLSSVKYLQSLGTTQVAAKKSFAGASTLAAISRQPANFSRWNGASQQSDDEQSDSDSSDSDETELN